MKRNRLLAIGLISLVWVVGGCGKDGGVAIDDDAMELVDKYLNDPGVVMFHDRLRLSRANIIREYERTYTAENTKRVDVELSFDEKRYDLDFENKVEVRLSTSFPMRVRIKSPFAQELLLVDDELAKIYRVKGVKQEDLKVEVVEVLPATDDYKTKKYYIAPAAK